MANEENLIPFNKRTESEQREYARKGGKKSGETRRQRKVIKEQMNMLLSMPFVFHSQKAFMQDMGIEEDDIDNQMALVVAMYGKALKGDVQAFKIIVDMMEENKPSEKQSDRIEIINDLPEDDVDV